jgi:hypothetical protein
MRILIDPPLKMTFNDVYMAIKSQPNSFSPDLKTTGGVTFAAEAALTRDGRRFISLPHNNRIYENDWGYRSNSMGKDGQRIAHYSIPLDEWAFHKKNVRKTTVQDDCLSLYERKMDVLACLYIVSKNLKVGKLKEVGSNTLLNIIENTQSNGSSFHHLS